MNRNNFIDPQSGIHWSGSSSTISYDGRKDPQIHFQTDSTNW